MRQPNRVTESFASEDCRTHGMLNQTASITDACAFCKTGENYVPLTTEDIKCDQAEPAAPAAGDSEQAAAAPAKPLGAASLACCECRA